MRRSKQRGSESYDDEDHLKRIKLALEKNAVIYDLSVAILGFGLMSLISLPTHNNHRHRNISKLL